jgi:ribulose-5-phosphate 4-epimerase/fuculose-1-phosphate aldolase
VEGGGSEAFEEVGAVAHLHSTSLVIDDALGTVGLEKFTAELIVFEAKLISEEAKCNISIALLVSTIQPIKM